VKFGCVVFELYERTNGQTDILITILRTPAGGQIKVNKIHSFVLGFRRKYRYFWKYLNCLIIGLAKRSLFYAENLFTVSAILISTSVWQTDTRPQPTPHYACALHMRRAVKKWTHQSEIWYFARILDPLLAICRTSGCTVASGVVGVVVVVVIVGVCNRSHMRTSKCTCLIFGVSIGLDAG